MWVDAFKLLLTMKRGVPTVTNIFATSLCEYHFFQIDDSKNIFKQNCIPRQRQTKASQTEGSPLQFEYEMELRSLSTRETFCNRQIVFSVHYDVADKVRDMRMNNVGGFDNVI